MTVALTVLYQVLCRLVVVRAPVKHTLSLILFKTTSTLCGIKIYGTKVMSYLNGNYALSCGITIHLDMRFD